MKTFTTIVAFIFSLLTLVAAAPLLVVRDVWVPPVITPTAGIVWKAGETYEVTWFVLACVSDALFVLSNRYRDTSTKPDQVTNSKGQVVLSKAGRLDLSWFPQFVLDNEADALIEHPLASGVDLQDGKVKVTIPANTSPANDYAIVCKSAPYSHAGQAADISSTVIGDSGNASPEFTIKGTKSPSKSRSLLV
jgi:hypothetical protein